jgi:hypothetical protein
LPGVPALFGEAENFAEAFPVEEIVTDGEVRLVADFIFVRDEHHVPAVAVAEDVGAVEEFVALAFEDHAEFVGRFYFVVDLLQDRGLHEAGFGGGEWDDGARS